MCASISTLVLGFAFEKSAVKRIKVHFDAVFDAIVSARDSRLSSQKKAPTSLCLLLRILKFRTLELVLFGYNHPK